VGSRILPRGVWSIRLSLGAGSELADQGDDDMALDTGVALEGCWASTSCVPET